MGLGTQIQFSTAYHPQNNGQTEWVNQVLEDMLRMYVMQQPTKGEEYLHLVEFSYNNGYHEFLGINHFEVLYGRKWRVPINCNNQEDKLILGPEILAKMEQAINKVR